MGVGLLAVAGRVGGDAAGLGLLDDLGADRGVEGEDDPLDVGRVQGLEPLELEDRRLEPQQQAEIGAASSSVSAPRPARRPFGAAEDRRAALRQRRRAPAAIAAAPARSR